MPINEWCRYRSTRTDGSGWACRILLLAGTTAALLGLPWPALTAPLLPPASSGATTRTADPLEPSSDAMPSAVENFPLPVYGSIGADPRFRDDLHLSAEQEKTLRDISERCSRERQRLYQEFEGPFDALPSHQREATFLKKTVQIRQELAKQFRPQIEEALTPVQLAACKKSSLADVLGQVLNDPEGLDRLGFTPEQRARLRRHDGNLLALLTAEQEQKLTEEADCGGHTFSAALLSGAGSFDADQALADYTEAIRTDPKFAEAYLGRALAREGKWDLDEALADYFDLDSFEHRAVWNEAGSRIEMHLASRTAQRVWLSALDIGVDFAEGETIHTENSYKYRPGQPEAMLAETGFAAAGSWTDERGWFSVCLGQVE